MKRLILLLSLFVLMFTSCAKKIDGSSKEAMQSSIAEISESMNEEEKTEFQQALMLVTFSGVELRDLIKDKDPDETAADLLSVLDGMTASEVISLAEEIKEKRK
ncbi:MAG: DUF6694 family lipoprotein [Hyphomicrobiales bacterium]